MIYWRVQFKDGSFGYQVMWDGGVAVTDLTGLVLTGNLEYTTVDVNPTEALPEIRYA